MIDHGRVAILAFGLAAGASVPALAGVEGAAGLLPHRAVYDLKLKDASDRSGIEGLSGRMVYEFTGSACTGFTTNFRFVTRINTGEDTRLTDQQTTTFEDTEKGEFRFETKSFTDEQLDKEVSGAATEADSKVKVAIDLPDPREVELTASAFPTEHMLEVIRNARNGNRFFEARIFDGSENGDQSMITNTVIGPQQQPQKEDAGDAAKAGEFADAAYWPVSIAYFNDGGSGDTTPVYSMSFKLYDNGITRDLTMDYGDFVLSGSLSRLDLLDKPNCDQTKPRP
ncbi:cell envelope integrity EipB family protein [Pseudorhizobium flavum]|uniref:cell envelope integrity EipB family protein n=1 Tax=Pseudorhizobium flavum TaxID=1335061 RepID=UPI00376FA94E